MQDYPLSWVPSLPSHPGARQLALVPPEVPLKPVERRALDGVDHGPVLLTSQVIDSSDLVSIHTNYEYLSHTHVLIMLLVRSIEIIGKTDTLAHVAGAASRHWSADLADGDVTCHFQS